MPGTDYIAYVNGTFVPLSQAKVGIEDRAVLFADSVYEVVLVARGQLIDLAGHMARLERSVTELRFPAIDLSTVSCRPRAARRRECDRRGHGLCPDLPR